jgi:hypothetical protein
MERSGWILDILYIYIYIYIYIKNMVINYTEERSLRGTQDDTRASSLGKKVNSFTKMGGWSI